MREKAVSSVRWMELCDKFAAALCIACFLLLFCFIHQLPYSKQLVQQLQTSLCLYTVSMTVSSGSTEVHTDVQSSCAHMPHALLVLRSQPCAPPPLSSLFPPLPLLHRLPRSRDASIPPGESASHCISLDSACASAEYLTPFAQCRCLHQPGFHFSWLLYRELRLVVGGNNGRRRS